MVISVLLHRLGTTMQFDVFCFTIIVFIAQRNNQVTVCSEHFTKLRQFLQTFLQLICIYKDIIGLTWEQNCTIMVNKKQCSRQLQCHDSCGVGNVINSSLFINSSLSSLSSTSHDAFCPQGRRPTSGRGSRLRQGGSHLPWGEGGLVGGRGQMDISVQLPYTAL